MYSLNPGRDMATTLRFLGSNDGQALVSARLAVDPVTHELEFAVFTDDGHGNGTHLFTVAWSDLCEIALRHQQA